MTQEEKDLLLKDLSARLRYGVKCKIDKFEVIFDLRGLDNDDSAELRQSVIVWKEHYPSSVISYPLIDCKPYLRPMSSMTEEEKKMLENYISTETIVSRGGLYDVLRAQRHTTNYLYSRHLDVLGLIEEGLALEAPEGMYEF